MTTRRNKNGRGNGHGNGHAKGHAKGHAHGDSKRSSRANVSGKLMQPEPTAESADAKRALPLYSEPQKPRLPNTPTCTSCGLCCSYVAIEVDSPVTVKQATQLLWYVYHEGVSLYVNDDEWMVQFDTTCIHLQPDYRCGVYETRPHICREFSEQDCEVNTGDDGRTFYNASEFLEHLSQTRPRIHSIVKKSFSPPLEATRSRLAPFEHRFAAVMSRRSALNL